MPATKVSPLSPSSNQALNPSSNPRVPVVPAALRRKCSWAYKAQWTDIYIQQSIIEIIREYHEGNKLSKLYTNGNWS